MAKARAENAFEVLSREEAAPEVEDPASVVSEEDVKRGLVGEAALHKDVKPSPGGQAATLVDAPPTPGRGGPSLAKTQGKPPIKTDISKAPGSVSYAEAAKEHGEAAEGKAREGVEAGKEAAGEAAQAAKEHGEAAEGKAREGVEAGKEAAGEAAQAVKAKAGQAAEAADAVGARAKESAISAKDAAAHKAQELADATRDRAAAAGEAAKEYGEAAKEKAAEVAHVVGDSVSQAVGFIREHLPEVHVERADTSPEDREAQALLDEAMAMAGGAPVPIRTPPAQPAAAPAPKPAPTSGNTGAASSQEVPSPGHYVAYPPDTATDAMNRAAETAAEATEAARDKAAELVSSTPDSSAARDYGASARDAAKAAAPDELAARVEREEQSAKGPLEALTDAVKGAAEFVKERVMHVPSAARETAAEARDSAVGGMRAAGQEVEGTARATADKAGAAYEQAREAAGSAADAAAAKVEEAKEAASDVAGRVAGAARDAADRVEGTAKEAAGSAANSARDVAGRAEGAAQQARGAASESAARTGAGLGHPKHEGVKTHLERDAPSAADAAAEARDRSAGVLASARDTISGAARSVEDRAASAFKHTKEEVKEGLGQLAPRPESPEAALRTAGIIPSDTETLLKQRGGAAHEHTAAAEPTLPPDVTDVSTETGGSGGEGLKAALGRASAGAKEAAHEARADLKEAVGEVQHDKWGDEGELPS